MFRIISAIVAFVASVVAIIQFVPSLINQETKLVKNDIPNIYGKKYSEARKILIDEGWIPNERHFTYGDKFSYGNAKDFWDMGYHEIDDCAGTGLAPCKFDFYSPYGSYVTVTTIGENALHATVKSYAFKKGRNGK
jgi:hypothetical protein